MDETNNQRKLVLTSIVILIVFAVVGFVTYIMIDQAQKNTEDQIKKTETQAGAKLKTKSGFRLKVLNNQTQIGKEVRIAVYANSAKKDVIGFDIALSYPKMLAYIGSSTELTGFDIIETIEDVIIKNQKGSKIIVTGAKQIGNKNTAIWNDSQIMILKFKPMKTGFANITFDMSPGSLSDTNMFDSYNKDLVTIAVGSTVQIQ